MRKLGLIVLSLALGCKAAPETSPAGASSPVASSTATPAPPQQTAETPPPAAPPTASATGNSVAPPTAATPPAAAGARTYPDSTKSIQAKAGEKFSVALPANITVPYKWRLEPAPDAKVIAVGEESYIAEPPKDCQGCVGYGGTRIFSFTAAGAGKAELHFALRPLNEPKGAAQKEARISVEVK
jgi:predicted secreted protein